MNAPDSSQAEITRIRAAYLRRDHTVPKDRYSIFKEENLLARSELERRIIRLLRSFQHADLRDEKILDVGCGSGFWLRQFIQWGARPNNLFGIDLLEEKIQEGMELCPNGTVLKWGDASQLQFEDNTFNIVLQFTVFTSILDPTMRGNVAREMSRVLRPGGAILWYDYFVSNPSNPDVRGVTRKEISSLFPGLSILLKRMTLAPPIGRAIGSISPSLHRLLSAVKPLCTHYLGFLQKQ